MGEPGCGLQEIRDSISVWRVCSILATLPIFWTLYDQQFSAWVLQAKSMNLHGFVQPEQLGVLDPLLVLVLLPLMQNYIYPRWRRSQLLQKFPPTHLKGLELVWSLQHWLLFFLHSCNLLLTVVPERTRFQFSFKSPNLPSWLWPKFGEHNCNGICISTCSGGYESHLSVFVLDVFSSWGFAWRWVVRELGLYPFRRWYIPDVRISVLLNAGIFALVSRAFVPYNANAGNGQSNRDEDNNQHGEAAANAQPASSVFHSM